MIAFGQKAAIKTRQTAQGRRRETTLRDWCRQRPPQCSKAGRCLGRWFTSYSAAWAVDKLDIRQVVNLLPPASSDTRQRSPRTGNASLRPACCERFSLRALLNLDLREYSASQAYTRQDVRVYCDNTPRILTHPKLCDLTPLRVASSRHKPRPVTPRFCTPQLRFSGASYRNFSRATARASCAISGQVKRG